MGSAVRPETVLAGRYRVLRPLGKGGMGEVFAAENTRTGRNVAVKVLRAERRTDAAVERFRREALAAGRIQSDHVTEIIDVEEDPEHGLVLVFELLEGESLVERLERTGPLSFAELHPLVEQVWRGLEAAHRAGVVHRDLKPSNIFLERRPDGARVKILDFGVSKLPRELADQSLTKTGQSLGTFSFMPPEQVEMSRQVDHRADVYSVGTVIFQALTGRLPFVASNLILLLELKTRTRAASLSDVSTTPIDPRLEAFVARALERRPEDRFATASEALEAWRALRPPAHSDAPAAPAPAISGVAPLGTVRMLVPVQRPSDPRLAALLDAAVVLRRVGPEAVLELLGRAVTPPVADLAEARTLVWRLARETQLFLPAQGDGPLVFKPEVRRSLAARAAAERPEELRGLHARAAYWHELRFGAEAAADVVYHYLALGLFEEADARWAPALAAELAGARDDLPEEAQAWLDQKALLDDDPTTRRIGGPPAPEAAPPARAPELPRETIPGAPAAIATGPSGAPEAADAAKTRLVGAEPPRTPPPPAPPPPPEPRPAPPVPQTAPKPEAEPATQPLTGTARAEPVTFLEAVVEAQRAVVPLWVPRVEGGRALVDDAGTPSGSRGTGFLVAPDLLLTALYVVRARRPGDTMPDDGDLGEQIRGATIDGERRGRGVLASSEPLGYALVELAPDPRARVARLRREPFGGGRAVVVHFAPATKTAVFTQASAPSRSRIEYLADGSRGWYGAPLFDADLQVVGVDWGARVREGVSLRLAAPVVDILADLAQRFPAVHARLLSR